MVSPTKESGVSVQWLIIATAIAITAGALVSAIWQGGNTEQGWLLANRYLVRVGFPLFYLSFIASSVLYIHSSAFTKGLLKNRRYLGIGFAIAHFTHLLAIVMYSRYSDEQIDNVTLIGGGFTYILIGLMALTSNNYSVRLLGRNWKRLHKFGAYVIWLIFAITYQGRVSEYGMESPFLVPLGLLVIALFLRIAISIHRNAMANTKGSTMVNP